MCEHTALRPSGFKSAVCTVVTVHGSKACWVSVMLGGVVCVLIELVLLSDHIFC